MGLSIGLWKESTGRGWEKETGGRGGQKTGIFTVCLDDYQLRGESLAISSDGSMHDDCILVYTVPWGLLGHALACLRNILLQYNTINLGST